MVLEVKWTGYFSTVKLSCPACEVDVFDVKSNGSAPYSKLYYSRVLISFLSLLSLPFLSPLSLLYTLNLTSVAMVGILAGVYQHIIEQ